MMASHLSSSHISTSLMVKIHLSYINVRPHGWQSGDPFYTSYSSHHRLPIPRSVVHMSAKSPFCFNTFLDTEHLNGIAHVQRQCTVSYCILAVPNTSEARRRLSQIKHRN